MKLIENNLEHGYRIYRSQEIVDNKEQFLREVDLAVRRFDNFFPNQDKTWTYNLYNTFSLTIHSPLFWRLYMNLQYVVREYLQTRDPLWFQSWINYHTPDKVLDWHDHIGYICHGYISIEPQKTCTIFEKYVIENEVGNIYVGPANRIHKVQVEGDFDGPRVTLGYDVVDKTLPKKVDFTNLSFIPI